MSVLSIVLIVIGLVGCVLPVLPGPILAFGGYLLLLLTPAADNIGAVSLFMAGFVTLLTIVADFVVPVLGVKMFEGSDYGKWGSFIGGIAGVFFMPVGLIAGPFIGAFVGELIAGRELDVSLKSAVGSVIGFLCGAIFKIIAVLFILILAIKAIV
ncbi:MAG: DUF456 domain-containing protein [Muribaculaceae bacterium]|nr:DUF456 domain-containing protein [Muribaculaceae bacterium]